MTLFVAMTAGLLAGLLQCALTSNIARTTLKIGGIIMTVIFLLLDARAMEYWNHYRERAIELEKVLGFEQYTKAPAIKNTSATNVVRFLYLSVLVFWLVAIIWNSDF